MLAGCDNYCFLTLYMPTPGIRRIGIELLLVSFGALCLELALIRWLPGQVRVAAYFPNLILIASFLGLGVGALVKTGGGLRLVAGLLLVVLGGLGLGRVIFTANNQSEHLWLLYYDMPAGAPVVNSVVLPVIGLFVLVTFAFLPLGSEIARRLELFREKSRTLLGYALDLGGSLGGVLTFLVLSEIGTRPVVWFAVGLAAVLGGVGQGRWQKVGFLLVAFGTLCAIHHYDAAERYSPYYGIRTQMVSDGSVRVLTNGSLHQLALDLRKEPARPLEPGRQKVPEGYRLGVSSLQKLPKRALVLGAGTGNDVSVLLDAGVAEVHAVEIDPVILEIGRTLHPARPYQDPRVTVHNTDARAFLERTELEFDFIVFGTLDSMTRLSAMSNVRLDNFVYTVECMQAARSRLAEDGALALFFMSSGRQMDARLFAILSEAFQAPPLLRSEYYQLFNRLFLAGPGVAHLRNDSVYRDLELESLEEIPTPSDDWPYLYLRQPTIPGFYLEVAALIVLFAAVLVFGLSRPLRLDVSSGRIDVEMMLFGAAFLLLETAFVTELNLLFGATWRTSGVVFAAILAAILIATLLSRRWLVDPRISLSLVAAALIGVAWLPLREIAPVGGVGKVLFALMVCGVPVAASGFAFAARFAARTNVQTAFGWNILGAVFGGLLELFSMLTGLKAMFMLAALIYAALLLMAVRRARPNKASSDVVQELEAVRP